MCKRNVLLDQPARAGNATEEVLNVLAGVYVTVDGFLSVIVSQLCNMQCLKMGVVRVMASEVGGKMS